MIDRIRHSLELTSEEQLQRHFNAFLKRQRKSSQPLPLPPSIKSALKRGQVLRSSIPPNADRVFLSSKDGVLATLDAEYEGHLFNYALD